MLSTRSSVSRLSATVAPLARHRPCILPLPPSSEFNSGWPNPPCARESSRPWREALPSILLGPPCLRQESQARESRGELIENRFLRALPGTRRREGSRARGPGAHSSPSCPGPYPLGGVARPGAGGDRPGRRSEICSGPGWRPARRLSARFWGSVPRAKEKADGT